MAFGKGKPQAKAAVTSTIVHPALGEVTVARNSRARRITLSVRPPARIRLTLPPRVSQAEGMQFLDSKQEWVLKALKRVQAKSHVEVISPPYSTRRHILVLRPAVVEGVRVRIAGGEITVAYPQQADHRETAVQQAIKKGIEEAWRIEARELLPARTAELARTLGLRYGSVTVRNTVSKWGSCSARNDISLSLHLMRLPDHLIDYVIIHELCHTVHKNHGPQFHALLDSYTSGRHLQLRKELRTYTTRW